MGWSLVSSNTALGTQRACACPGVDGQAGVGEWVGPVRPRLPLPGSHPSLTLAASRPLLPARQVAPRRQLIEQHGSRLALQDLDI